MFVSDQHSRDAMWEKTRLSPHFLRSVKVEKRPVGRVYEIKGEFPEHKAEVEDAYVLILSDPKTGHEHEVVVDPRHAQSKEHLKIAQDVLEGRVGGLTPIRLSFESTSALDPEGRPIPGTEITRVAEMESPSPTRGEAKVLVGDKVIGDWTPELDVEVDRAVSFEIAENFAVYMQGIQNDPDETAWKALDAAARVKLKKQWEDRFTDPGIMEEQIERFAPTREDFLAGRHASASLLQRHQRAWDPERNDVPASSSETGGDAQQATFLYQKTLIETFQARMQKIECADQEGNLFQIDAITKTETDLIQAGHLPAGRPKRNVEINRIVVDEKARAISTHMFAGYLKTQGARIMDPDLKKELDDPRSMNSDILAVLTATPDIKPEAHTALYFRTAEDRADTYQKAAAKKVEQEARKSMKFAVGPVAADVLAEKMNMVSSVSGNLADHMSKAGQDVESLGFGL